jgi:hypothetical protein
MTLAKNELRDVRSASGTIPRSGGYDSTRGKKQDLIFGEKKYKKKAARQKLCQE